MDGRRKYFSPIFWGRLPKRQRGQEVTNNLHLLNYVINGMAELYNIDDDTIIAINSLIYRALGSTKELTESRKPLTLNYDPKTMYYKSSFVPEETMEL